LANIAAFEKILHDLDQDVLGILEFLQENEKDLGQVTGESKQAINLITIHSCKGLEFDTVFYFLNCSNRSNNAKSLKSFVRYNPDFSEVERSLLTFHYPKLANTLFEDMQDKEKSEILNLAYVALTRAKNNLFLFTNLDLKSVDDPKKTLNVWGEIASNMRLFFADEQIDESDETYFSAQKGLPLFAQVSKKKETPADDWREEMFHESKELSPVNIEKINKENALFGEMVHYYLSYVRWNTESEKRLARKMTVNKFGKKWQSNFTKIEKFLQKNSWLYDPKKWESILCEYPLLLEEKEYRLDRVMISKDKQKATLVDYKTGSIEDPEQLNVYKEIFQKASGISDVETIFLEVK